MIKIQARGPMTRQCAPGDIIEVVGVYLPSPGQGFSSIRSGLHHDTHIEAYKITKSK